MRFVSCYGGLWRITEIEYLTMLGTIAEGREYQLPGSHQVSSLPPVDITDMTSEQAADLLEEYRSRRRATQG